VTYCPGGFIKAHQVRRNMVKEESVDHGPAAFTLLYYSGFHTCAVLPVKSFPVPSYAELSDGE